jgi:hypothetical protein
MNYANFRIPAHAYMALAAALKRSLYSKADHKARWQHMLDCQAVANCLASDTAGFDSHSFMAACGLSSETQYKETAL